jgi:hypothetical protein
MILLGLSTKEKKCCGTGTASAKRSSGHKLMRSRLLWFLVLTFLGFEVYLYVTLQCGAVAGAALRSNK